MFNKVSLINLKLMTSHTPLPSKYFKRDLEVTWMLNLCVWLTNSLAFALLIYFSHFFYLHFQPMIISELCLRT